MHAVNKEAAKVLDMLTNDGTLLEARRIDNRPGTFLALSVEQLTLTADGPIFAIAHRVEVNGDLCSDPDVELLRHRDGRWYPVAITQHLVGVHRQCMEMGYEGVRGYRPRAQREIAAFVGVWMRNVVQQQGRDLAPPEPGDEGAS